LRSQGKADLHFQQNVESEVDEGIKWLITLFRLRPDKRAFPAIEQESAKFVCFRGPRQITLIGR
jgi:hypothetical protein